MNIRRAAWCYIFTMSVLIDLKTTDGTENYGWKQYVGRECEKLDACSCKLEGSEYIISLRKLDQENGSLFSNVKDADDQYLKYYFNPCTPMQLPQTLPDVDCTNGIACQYNAVGGTVYFNRVIATANDVKIRYDDSVNQYVFHYVGKPVGGFTPKTSIVMECDPKQEPPLFKSGFKHDVDFTFTATLTTKCACPGMCVTPQLAKKLSANAKSSSWTIVMISLVAFVAVGFVFGTGYNYFCRHKKGYHAVPFASFLVSKISRKREIDMDGGYIAINSFDDSCTNLSLLQESKT